MPYLDIRGDADKAWQAMQAGGIAILPLDVAYGIFAQKPQGVTGIFEAKGRSFSKPSGSLGSIEIIREVQILAPRDLDIARCLVEDYDLPFSTVAPFRPEHPFFAKLDPIAIERSTKAGTLDALINAG